MNHALKLLQDEDDRLTAELSRLHVEGKPKSYRASEWAMTIGSLKRKRMEVFEAIQLLKKVGKD